MAKNNPFTLSFGMSPNEFISRYEYSDEIVNTFSATNPVSHAYLIEGIRRSGKTVLMTTIEKELQKEKNWIVVDLNSTQDLLSDFALKLVDSCKESVSVIYELLENLKKKNKKILITIDEVMNGENMRHFASEFQIMLRKDLPVFLLMTGLYENIYSIQNDPALTFLLRTPKIKMEPLSLAQITKVYQNVFKTDIDMAKKLAKLTKGYAFAFQALSEQDKNVIIAITDSKTSVSEICKKLNMTSQTFSKYRQRLLERGIIQAPQHGYVEIVLPRFAEFAKYYVD